MTRSFISSWTATASPTTSDSLMKSFGNGRTTTITIARTARWADRPRTNDWWRKRERRCHQGPETLHILFGGPSRTRTCDLLVRSQTLYPTELWAPRRSEL